MGRWAQRRVRGGGGVPSAPLTVVSITAVTSIDPTHVQVTFSAAVSVITGATADTNFDVNADPPTDVQVTDATRVLLEVPDGSAGNPWQITGQPAWLTTTVTYPDSGTVAA